MSTLTMLYFIEIYSRYSNAFTDGMCFQGIPSPSVSVEVPICTAISGDTGRPSAAKLAAVLVTCFVCPRRFSTQGMSAGCSTQFVFLVHQKKHGETSQLDSHINLGMLLKWEHQLPHFVPGVTPFPTAGSLQDELGLIRQAREKDCEVSYKSTLPVPVPYPKVEDLWWFPEIGVPQNHLFQ